MRPRLSKFPAVDLLTQYTVEDEDRCVVYQGHSASATQRDGVMRWIGTLSIKWARPVSTGNVLGMFVWDGGRPLSSCAGPDGTVNQGSHDVIVPLVNSTVSTSPLTTSPSL